MIRVHVDQEKNIRNVVGESKKDVMFNVCE